jgi:hypothetical protein
LNSAVRLLQMDCTVHAVTSEQYSVGTYAYMYVGKGGPYHGYLFSVFGKCSNVSVQLSESTVFRLRHACHISEELFLKDGRNMCVREEKDVSTHILPHKPRDASKGKRPLRLCTGASRCILTQPKPETKGECLAPCPSKRGVTATRTSQRFCSLAMCKKLDLGSFMSSI